MHQDRRRPATARRRTIGRVLPLAMAALATGCSIKAPMQHLVVDQNTILAKSTDEVMLVNILRARNNAPMHFSLVTQFHGTATLTAGLTLGATFPATSSSQSVTDLSQPGMTVNNSTTTTSQVTPGASSWSPSASGSFSETPSFDATTIDSQSFFQGFLAPIDPATVGHFLYDGWSPRLLTYLLVQRVELVSAHDYDRCGNIIEAGTAEKPCPQAKAPGKTFIHKDEVIGYLDNDPFQYDLANNANPFAALVVHFQITGIGTKKGADQPLFEIRGVTDLAGLDKIDGNTFDIKDGKLVRLGTDKAELVLSRIRDDAVVGRDQAADIRLTFLSDGVEIVDPAIGDKTDLVDRQQRQARGNVISASRIFTPTDLVRSGRVEDPAQLVSVKKEFGGDTATVPRVQAVLKPRLRSPEAVFFFVGEYLRKAEEDAKSGDGAKSGSFKVTQDWPWGQCTEKTAVYPMIKVTSQRPAKALLSAELDGVRYYIPDSASDCNGQSMKVLTLLEQLFYLQLSASDKLGLTPTVHIAP